MSFAKPLSIVVVVLTLGATIWAVCATPSLPPAPNIVEDYLPPENQGRAALQLSLFEHILRSEISSPYNDDKVSFVSLGYNSMGHRIEPPAELINRLSDMRVEVQPVSLARLPADGEIYHGIFRGVETMDTQEEASIYSVRIIEWLDETRVKVNYGRFGGPLDGGGVNGAVFEFARKKWKEISRDSSWVS